METTAKQEQQEAEQQVHNNRHSDGVGAAYKWLKLRQGDLNRTWPGKSGDELLQAQGEARLLQKLIRVIEEGPTIKREVERPE